MSSKNSNGSEKHSLEEQLEKIKEVRNLIGPLSGKLALYCSDAAVARYLRARNWNVKKAVKMLKESLKWRQEYKPEEICWEDVALEAQTGKVYRSDIIDKHGRTVLVMRPSCQNTNSTKGQIKYLVYCMESAVVNLALQQEQMVWLIDFKGFNLANLSVKITKETAHVLQEHYPERLAIAILYNPPKIFESFWMVVKPFLEPKTYRKVKFAYSDDVGTRKIMEDLFDMDQLESAFGGNNPKSFDITEYGEMMTEDDKKKKLYWSGVTRMPSEPSIQNLVAGISDVDSSEEYEENLEKSTCNSPHQSFVDNLCGSNDENCNGANAESCSTDNGIPKGDASSLIERITLEPPKSSAPGP